MDSVIRLILAGDAMLGRLVGDAIRAHGPDYPLGAIARQLAAADIAIINLECAITDSTRRWQGAPKAFYFGAPSLATESLQHAGVDLAVLANNHILDFDIAGLTDTLANLDRAGIRHVGAGADLDAARAPAVVSERGISIGLVAYCDHQEDFAASPTRPGIAYLDLENEEHALRVLTEDVVRMRDINVDWPILSLHWGPNMVDRPSPAFREFAHRVIDAGFRLLFGHSAHVFHGIEIYKGCPIIYAAGDLVDDYYVDPLYRNDHQLLFEVELSADRVCAIRMRPILIGDCRVAPAEDGEFEFIRQRAERLNGELGTELVTNPDGTLGVVI